MTTFRIILLALCVGSFSLAFAQAGESQDNGLRQLVENAHGTKTIATINPFGTVRSMDAQELDRALSAGIRAECSSRDRQILLANAERDVLMSLPTPDGGSLDLKLTASRQLIGRNFLQSIQDRPEAWKQGLHYKGIVDSDESSLAAISFFEDRVIGVVSFRGESFVIATERDNQVLDTEHVIIYTDSDILLSNDAACATEDALYPPEAAPDHEAELRSSAVCKKVRVRFDCDYRMYQDNGSSIASTEAEVMGWFNVCQALYLVDGLEIEISEINVFTSSDPYTGTTDPGTILGWYRGDMNSISWDGDIAHLVSTRPIGAGGVGYLTSNLCSTSFNYCYSNISNSYASFPFYSWTVDVVSHEMGHVMGSNHTHWCFWPSGALDNCYTTEGSCPPGPGVGSGGTIMSYCHLTSAGKDFSKGFHPEPVATIESNLNAAACLDLCAGVSNCATPTGTFATASVTSVDVSWNPVPDAGAYIARGRRFGTTNFKNKTIYGTSKTIGGLTPATLYEWQVQAYCNDGSVSDWTVLNLFTTLLLRSAGPELNIYPNPAADFLIISANPLWDSPVEVSVLDLNGRILLHREFSDLQESRRIDEVGELASGMYQLSVTGAAGTATVFFKR